MSLRALYLLRRTKGYGYEVQIKPCNLALDDEWRKRSWQRLITERCHEAVHLEWCGIWLLLRALRANQRHVLRDSVFALVPMIRDMMGALSHDGPEPIVQTTKQQWEMLAPTDLHHFKRVTHRCTELEHRHQYHPSTATPSELAALHMFARNDGAADRLFSSLSPAPWSPALDSCPVVSSCVQQQREIIRVLYRFANTRYAKSVIDE